LPTPMLPAIATKRLIMVKLMLPGASNLPWGVPSRVLQGFPGY
jgi:hypothetical protein